MLNPTVANKETSPIKGDLNPLPLPKPHNLPPHIFFLFCYGCTSEEDGKIKLYSVCACVHITLNFAVSFNHIMNTYTVYQFQQTSSQNS